MRFRIIILKLTVILLVSISVIQVNAQQSRVDSVITLLNKSNTSNGLDTLVFNNARQLIRTAVLSDAQITQIENVADKFKKGEDEDLCYAVKFVVMVSLSSSDKFKAIDYGKMNLIKLEKSETPRSNYLIQAFLSQLRLPYRNSSKLPEGFQFYAEKLNHYKMAKDSLGLSTCYYVLGGFYRNIGLYEPAMYNMKKSISFLDSSDFNGQRYLDFTVNIGKAGWINNGYIIADFFVQMGEYENAIKQGELILKAAIDYYKAGGKGASGGGLSLTYGARHLAVAKILTNQLDSVDYYLKLAEKASAMSIDKSSKPVLLQHRSLYDIRRGAYSEADSLLQQCWRLVNQYQIPVVPSSGIVEPDYYLALLRIEQKKIYRGNCITIKKY